MKQSAVAVLSASLEHRYHNGVLEQCRVGPGVDTGVDNQVDERGKVSAVLLPESTGQAVNTNGLGGSHGEDRPLCRGDAYAVKLKGRRSLCDSLDEFPGASHGLS